MQKEFISFKLSYYPRGTALAFIQDQDPVEKNQIMGDYFNLTFSSLGCMSLEDLLDENDCLLYDMWNIDAWKEVKDASGIAALSDYSEVIEALENEDADVFVNLEKALRDFAHFAKGNQTISILTAWEVDVHVSYYPVAEVDYVDCIYLGTVDLRNPVLLEF